MKKKKFNAIKFAVGTLAIACFLSVWFFATREGTTLGKLMPNPAEVASRLMEATYDDLGPYVEQHAPCFGGLLHRIRIRHFTGTCHGLEPHLRGYLSSNL